MLRAQMSKITNDCLTRSGTDGRCSKLKTCSTELLHVSWSGDWTSWNDDTCLSTWLWSWVVSWPLLLHVDRSLTCHCQLCWWISSLRTTASSINR